MAPFFKSSSLFNISRRRRKEQKSLDTVVSSPPMLHSRSLPNFEELQGIPVRFLEEFRPILQHQVVSTSSPLSENSASLEEISLMTTPVSSQAILASESDSPKEQDEYDSPKLDEQSTPRPVPSGTFKPISPPESNSIEVDEVSTPRVADCSNLGSVSSPECDSIEETSPYEPESSFVPSSEDNSGDLTPSLEPSPLTNCDLSESPVEQDAASEEPLIAAESNKSIPALSAITGLTPSKSTRASPPNTVKTASIREDESADFLKQLDDFAVFFGVEKPSKITSIPPVEIQATPGISSESDVSTLLTASDHGHNDDTPNSPTCNHLEMMESYKREIGYLDEIQASLEKSLARANDENSKLLEEREMLTEEYTQLQWNLDAERTKNAKLERILCTVKLDHIRILTRKDWVMNQLKRFNAAMVDLKLHAPVLFNAAHSVCNGEPADAALIAAIKEAATKFGSPWARILPAIVGDRPDENFQDAMQRCAKLEDDLRAATKKHLFWKMKAQMDPRHAKFVTPSSSSMSLVLDSCLPKEILELNHIDSPLSQLKTGRAPHHSQPPASSLVVAGSSRFEGACAASNEPNEDVPFKAPVASSPTLTPEESSDNMSCETPVASSPISIPEALCEDVSHEGPSPPILLSEELSEDELCDAPVTSSLVLVPEEPSEDSPSESVESPQMESSLEIIPSLALSGRPSFSCEAPPRVIRHYIPGRALFGEDGSGIAPLGLFDRYKHEDQPESPVLSHDSPPYPGLAESISVSMVRNYVVDHIEHVSYSQESLGLEYIDEIPVDGRANPILRDDSDYALRSENQEETLVSEPTISEITKVSEPLKDDVETIRVPKSESKRSFSSLKRLSASSSKLRQSISSGLKRLRQISFASNKVEGAEKPVSRPRAMTLQTHRRMPSAVGKENRPPKPKHSSTIAPRQRSSIPTRGIRRPTVSSALKTVQVPPSIITPSAAQQHQNQVSFETPVVSSTPTGKRAPFSNIPVRTNSQNTNTNTPRKVLDQGRRAVRTLVRLIY